MNFKTTGILFVLVVALGATIYLLPEQDVTVPEKPSPLDANAEAKTHQLIDENFGDAKRIEVSQPDTPNWVFERSGDGETTTWRMQSPYACIVQKWQVEAIASQLKKLTYTSKYDDASQTVTKSNTGLEPPRATVALTDENDETIRVHIGRNEGNRETYVSLNDEPTIYRVGTSLKALLKENALAYHDQSLFDVSIEDIARIEIREPNGGEAYTLVKTDADWRFEQPSPAKAYPDKIRKLCSTFAALRAQEWVAGNVSDLGQYGLDAGTRTVIVTTKPADSNAAARHELRIASVGPLGDDTKVYARRGDETTVGVVAKNLADTFRPNLKEWRDNRLIERDPVTARSLTLTLDGEATRFERSGTDWSFAETRRRADEIEINRLLTSIKNLLAVNFVSPGSGSDTEFGFENPKASIELKFDGNTPSVAVTIGSLTDTVSKKLNYIRANDTVAKVKTLDLATMLRSPSVYRDSTVDALPTDRLQAITIDRSAAATDSIGPDMSFTMTQTDGTWSMTAPVQRGVDTDQMDRLLSTLANLRAKKIIDVAPDGDLSQFGLSDPIVRLTYTSLPPKAFRVMPDAMNSNGTNRVEPIQPPAETFELSFGQADGKVYAQHAPTPEYVFHIAETLLPDFLAEYRNKQMFAFEAGDVTAVSFTQSENTIGLSNDEGTWTYAQEPDLPLDQAKVANYLLRVKNIMIARVVEYDTTNLGTYGLDAPRFQLSVSLKPGTLPALLISEKTDNAGNHFAKSAGAGDVFTVPAETIAQVGVNIDELE